jgi:hypothetical protein
MAAPISQLKGLTPLAPSGFKNWQLRYHRNSCSKAPKRFTTEETGKPCESFMLAAPGEYGVFALTEEREITLFELA